MSLIIQRKRSKDGFNLELLVALFYLIAVSSCITNQKKYRFQIDYTSKLIVNIKESNWLEAKDQMGINLEAISMNDEIFIAKLKKLKNIFNANSKVEGSEIFIREYDKKSSKLVDICVPIINQNKKKCIFVVEFVKFIDSQKIYHFRLVYPDNLEDDIVWSYPN